MQDKTFQEVFVGKKINKMFISKDQYLLKFICENNEEIILKTAAECCSDTWFADILFTYPKYFFGQPVKQFEEIVVPDFVDKLATKDDRARQEYDHVYGYKIKMSSGQSCDIIFRNSSNGYYGGWIAIVDMSNLHENTRKYIEQMLWDEITDDWSA
jgi:hypothetical protein